MTTKTFNPIDKGFRWTPATEQEPMGWYEYDGKPAEQAALRERNAEAKRLTKAGHVVRKGSLGKQTITRGGIGTAHPEITLIVPVYTLTIVS